MTLRTRRLTAWIALAAMLLGTLAPTVSHALALARTGLPYMQEVCTGSGMRWVAYPTSTADATEANRSSSSISTDAPAGQQSVLTLDHCPFCLLVADRLGPPPAALLHFFNAESGLAWPDEQALSFASVPPSAALPRGPPLID